MYRRSGMLPSARLALQILPLSVRGRLMQTKPRRRGLQRWPQWKMMLLVLAVLVTGCADSSPTQHVEPSARVPNLPENAKQPPTGSECTPSCSQGAQRLLNSMQEKLTEVEPQG